jgi:hypothetical protein
MTRVAYYVVPRRSAWAVRLNDKHFGPCSSQRAATDVAISAAKKAINEGCCPRVLVFDGDKFRIALEARRQGETVAA